MDKLLDSNLTPDASQMKILKKEHRAGQKSQALFTLDANSSLLISNPSEPYYGRVRSYQNIPNARSRPDASPQPRYNESLDHPRRTRTTHSRGTTLRGSIKDPLQISQNLIHTLGASIKLTYLKLLSCSIGRTLTSEEELLARDNEPEGDPLQFLDKIFIFAKDVIKSIEKGKIKALTSEMIEDYDHMYIN
jgi:hypothetical protein